MTTTFTPELLSEIVDNINRFMPARDATNFEGDDVYGHVCALKFPVTVSLMSGQPSKGLHINQQLFSLPLPPHMQTPGIVTIGVCSTLAFAAVKRLDLSVLVRSDEDHVGFAFAAGKELDDVVITPHIETRPTGEPL